MVLPSLASPAGRRSSAATALTRQLPALREALERQRDFRLEQLAHLTSRQEPNPRWARGPRRSVPPDSGASRALGEVRAAVAAGARHALADIELALARMGDGSYGRCRACDADIPLAVLTAIPRTTVCLACNEPAVRAPSTAT